jgi:hypothetical protein
LVSKHAKTQEKVETELAKKEQERGWREQRARLMAQKKGLRQACEVRTQKATDAETTELTLVGPYGKHHKLTMPYGTRKEGVLAEWGIAAGESTAKLIAENGACIHLFTPQGDRLEGTTTVEQLFEGEPPSASRLLHLRVVFYGGGGTKRVATGSGSQPKRRQMSIFAAFKFSKDQVSERGPY